MGEAEAGREKLLRVAGETCSGNEGAKGAESGHGEEVLR